MVVIRRSSHFGFQPARDETLPSRMIRLPCALVIVLIANNNKLFTPEAKPISKPL